MKKSNHDHPFREVAATAHQRILDGWIIFQKFTCQGCGRRIIINVPNALFAIGHCKHCDHQSDLLESGCNYLAVAGGTTEKVSDMLRAAEGDDETKH